MLIRQACHEEMPYVLRVYHTAQFFMQLTGNSEQWSDIYPDADQLIQDIENGQLYTVTSMGKIVGAFVMFTGEDPAYTEIDGAWCNDEPYISIHRVASDRTCHGILHEIVKYAAKLKGNIRIDTHEKNKVMLHLLESNGFTRCGIIHLADGTPRIALQRCNK